MCCLADLICVAEGLQFAGLHHACEFAPGMSARQLQQDTAAQAARHEGFSKSCTVTAGSGMLRFQPVHSCVSLMVKVCNRLFSNTVVLLDTRVCIHTKAKHVTELWLWCPIPQVVCSCRSTETALLCRVRAWTQAAQILMTPPQQECNMSIKIPVRLLRRPLQYPSVTLNSPMWQHSKDQCSMQMAFK